MNTIKFPVEYDQEELENWAAACETDFAIRLTDLSRRIIEANRPYIVLSGPSCSGKTTTSHKLIADLLDSGRRVKVISLDDFYLPRSLLLRRAADMGGKIDFDSPDTLDWRALAAFLDDIGRGRICRLPHYDFKTGMQTENECIYPDAYDLFLFEGIQAAYPQFLSMLPFGTYSAVFVSVESGLKLGGELLRPRQIRLARRMVRDLRFRGASPEFTLTLWHNVTANEDAYIFPGAASAHFKFDSLLGYELCLLKEPLTGAVAMIPPETVTSELRGLAHFCQQLPSISHSILPEHSILHEFLG